MNNNENIFEVFTINIPAQDKQTLQNAIVMNLEEHQLSAPENWAEFTITAVSNPQQSDNNAQLLSALTQATECYDQLYVDADITDTSLPLFTRVKQSFHQLVLFYVNKLGEKQTRFNDRILRVVNPLVQKQLQQETEIAELKAQIAQLQTKISELEQKK